jgi:SAM-dependent methyltransferase
MVLDASHDALADGGQAGEPAGAPASAIVWHDLECGAYAADLSLWRELAAPTGTAAGSHAVLDVGAGTGRVTLDLAHHGHRVTALELDPQLLGALRARAADTPVQAVCADARSFELADRDFAVCVVPMQTIQLFGGSAGRVAFLRCARRHLRPSGLLACAIVTELDPFDCSAGDLGPSPEIAMVDGAHYVSRAVGVSVGRHSIRIERERSVLAPDRPGASRAPSKQRDVVELDRLSVAQLQRDGREAGMEPAGVRIVPATGEHVGSEVVLLRA